MRGPRSAWTMTLDLSTRVILRDFLQRRKTPVGLARRAHAMLLLEQGHSSVQTATWVGLAAYHVRKWAKRFQEHGIAGLLEKPRRGRPPICAPEVALHLVKLACERPDQMGRALSQRDGPELARKLRADGIVQSISADTVARILRSHQLKTWRHHLWLSADVPRDEHYAQQISDLMAFVAEWNLMARPFNWTTKSAAKIMAKCHAQPLSAPAAYIPLLFSVVAYSISGFATNGTQRREGSRTACEPGYWCDFRQDTVGMYTMSAISCKQGGEA